MQEAPLDNESGFPIGYNGTIIVHTDRENLDNILPLGHTVPIWKVLAKIATQDLTRVSLPVILAEPLNALQRSTEMMANFNIVEMLVQKDQTREDASCKRLALCGIMQTCHILDQRARIKKPFNPILGETFELVNPKFRFFCEQVSHHPPITAYQGETDGFKVESISWVDQSFHFNKGYGALKYKQYGLQTYLLDQYKDVIKLSKMDLSACNFIMGNQMVEMEGKLQGINETNGDKLEIQFTPNTWRQNGTIAGQVYNADGKLMWTIEGVQGGFVDLIDSEGNREQIYKYIPFTAEEGRQYHLRQYQKQLNCLTDEMRNSGFIP